MRKLSRFAKSVSVVGLLAVSAGIMLGADKCENKNEESKSEEKRDEKKKEESTPGVDNKPASITQLDRDLKKEELSAAMQPRTEISEQPSVDLNKNKPLKQNDSTQLGDINKDKSLAPNVTLAPNVPPKKKSDALNDGKKAGSGGETP